MGQKVNPVGFRLSLNRAWNSKWYADKKVYADQLEEDLRIQDAGAESVLFTPDVSRNEGG